MDNSDSHEKIHRAMEDYIAEINLELEHEIDLRIEYFKKKHDRKTMLWFLKVMPNQTKKKEIRKWLDRERHIWN